MKTRARNSRHDLQSARDKVISETVGKCSLGKMMQNIETINLSKYTPNKTCTPSSKYKSRKSMSQTNIKTSMISPRHKSCSTLESTRKSQEFKENGEHLIAESEEPNFKIIDDEISFNFNSSRKFPKELTANMSQDKTSLRKTHTRKTRTNLSKRYSEQGELPMQASDKKRKRTVSPHRNNENNPSKKLKTSKSTKEIHQHEKQLVFKAINNNKDTQSGSEAKRKHGILTSMDRNSSLKTLRISLSRVGDSDNIRSSRLRKRPNSLVKSASQKIARQVKSWPTSQEASVTKNPVPDMKISLTKKLMKTSKSSRAALPQANKTSSKARNSTRRNSLSPLHKLAKISAAEKSPKKSANLFKFKNSSSQVRAINSSKRSNSKSQIIDSQTLKVSHQVSVVSKRSAIIKTRFPIKKSNNRTKPIPTQSTREVARKTLKTKKSYGRVIAKKQRMRLTLLKKTEIVSLAEREKQETKDIGEKSNRALRSRRDLTISEPVKPKKVNNRSSARRSLFTEQAAVTSKDNVRNTKHRPTQDTTQKRYFGYRTFPIIITSNQATNTSVSKPLLDIQINHQEKILTTQRKSIRLRSSLPVLSKGENKSFNNFSKHNKLLRPGVLHNDSIVIPSPSQMNKLKGKDVNVAAAKSQDKNLEKSQALTLVTTSLDNGKKVSPLLAPQKTRRNRLRKITKRSCTTANRTLRSNARSSTPNKSNVPFSSPIDKKQQSPGLKTRQIKVSASEKKVDGSETAKVDIEIKVVKQRPSRSTTSVLHKQLDQHSNTVTKSSQERATQTSFEIFTPSPTRVRTPQQRRKSTQTDTIISNITGSADETAVLDITTSTALRRSKKVISERKKMSRGLINAKTHKKTGHDSAASRNSQVYKSKERLSISKDRSSISKERLSISKDRSSISKERLSTSKERLPKSKEKLAKSKERLPKSKEMLPKSKERLAKSKERLPKSNETLSTSKERLPKSKERLPKSKERLPKSNETLSSSKERLPKSKERFPKSKERLPKSKERLSISKERLSISKERLSTSKERFPKSKERLSTSNERSPKSKERLSTSNERSPKSKERLSTSNERSPKSKERLSTSKERLPKSKERLSTSNERSPKSKERLSTSNERSPKSKERLLKPKGGLTISKEILPRSINKFQLKKSSSCQDITSPSLLNRKDKLQVAQTLSQSLGEFDLSFNEINSPCTNTRNNSLLENNGSKRLDSILTHKQKESNDFLDPITSPQEKVTSHRSSAKCQTSQSKKKIMPENKPSTSREKVADNVEGKRPFSANGSKTLIEKFDNHTQSKQSSGIKKKLNLSSCEDFVQTDTQKQNSVNQLSAKRKITIHRKGNSINMNSLKQKPRIRRHISYSSVKLIFSDKTPGSHKTLRKFSTAIKPKPQQTPKIGPKPNETVGRKSLTRSVKLPLKRFTQSFLQKPKTSSIDKKKQNIDTGKMKMSFTTKQQKNIAVVNKTTRKPLTNKTTRIPLANKTTRKALVNKTTRKPLANKTTRKALPNKQVYRMNKRKLPSLRKSASNFKILGINSFNMTIKPVTTSLASIKVHGSGKNLASQTTPAFKSKKSKTSTDEINELGQINNNISLQLIDKQSKTPQMPKKHTIIKTPRKSSIKMRNSANSLTSSLTINKRNSETRRSENCVNKSQISIVPAFKGNNSSLLKNRSKTDNTENKKKLNNTSLKSTTISQAKTRRQKNHQKSSTGTIVVPASSITGESEEIIPDMRQRKDKPNKIKQGQQTQPAIDLRDKDLLHSQKKLKSQILTTANISNHNPQLSYERPTELTRQHLSQKKSQLKTVKVKTALPSLVVTESSPRNNFDLDVNYGHLLSSYFVQHENPSYTTHADEHNSSDVESLNASQTFESDYGRRMLRILRREEVLKSPPKYQSDKLGEDLTWDTSLNTWDTPLHTWDTSLYDTSQNEHNGGLHGDDMLKFINQEESDEDEFPNFQIEEGSDSFQNEVKLFENHSIINDTSYEKDIEDFEGLIPIEHASQSQHCVVS